MMTGLVFLQHCRVCRLSNLLNARHVACSKHFLCPEILLPVSFLSYLVLFVRVRIAKCYVNSKRQFLYMLILENENTLSLLICHACICRASTQLAQQQPLNQGNIDLSVMSEVRKSVTGGNSFCFHFCTIEHSFCLGCILNDALYMYMPVCMCRKSSITHYVPKMFRKHSSGTSAPQ
jgi:hypothetical protein